MKQASDLTRWNRAGLGKFRYVDGNAAEYLETLRGLFAEHFDRWDLQGSMGAFDNSASIDESPLERQQRLLAQYHGEPRDLTWELARSFCRACHVLTETVDAYANEAYIGTASQWDHLRRLVEMLDYHPAPPASASALLLLQAKTGKWGKVAKGFQVKNVGAGGEQVIFETLNDLDVYPTLNELRVAGYDRSPDVISGNKLVLEEEVKDLAVGDPLVMENSQNRHIEAFMIQSVSIAKSTTTIILSADISSSADFKKGHTLVHLLPTDKLALLGPLTTHSDAVKNLLLYDDVDSLVAGDAVYISDNKKHAYRRIKDSQSRHLVLGNEIDSLDLTNAYVSLARQVPVIALLEGSRKTIKVVGDYSYLQDQYIADAASGKEGTKFKVIAAKYIPVKADEPESGYSFIDLDNVANLGSPQTLLVPPITKQWRVSSYLKNDSEQPFATSLQTGMARRSAANDMAVVVSGADYAWGRLANVSTDNDSASSILTAENWFYGANVGRFYVSQSLLYSNFTRQVRHQGWQQNDTSITGKTLILAGAPHALLKSGQRLFIEQQVAHNFQSGLETTLVAVDSKQVEIAHELTGLGFTRGNTVVRGNVVMAGHGERRAQKVIGSGDGSLSNQFFLLAVSNVSFVADTKQATGVRAAIEVSVEDERWTQVATLSDSTPTDSVYTVRMTEDGFLRIGFGDGSKGRRLPTGNNNIRVLYRQGVGLVGNVQPGSLDKMVSPHRLVEAVRQPIAASGGGDPESHDALRTSASATLLTLERAVSSEDFASLAAGHSSVWQARAFQRQSPGQLQVVEVVVVPAGGVALRKLKNALELYLQDHGIPQIHIEVSEFQRARLSLFIKIVVDMQKHNSEETKASVLSALLRTFSLEQRRIGQELYLSEIYKVVEAVKGVDKSICRIESVEAGAGELGYVVGQDEDIKVVRPGDHQVVYLDRDQAAIRLELEGRSNDG